MWRHYLKYMLSEFAVKQNSSYFFPKCLKSVVTCFHVFSVEWSKEETRGFHPWLDLIFFPSLFEIIHYVLFFLLLSTRWVQVQRWSICSTDISWRKMEDLLYFQVLFILSLTRQNKTALNQNSKVWKMHWSSIKHIKSEVCVF